MTSQAEVRSLGLLEGYFKKVIFKSVLAVREVKV